MFPNTRLSLFSLVPALAFLALALPGRDDLSDAEVAHVAVTAGAIDAELGRLAGERATAPEVKRFAKTMVNDHTSVNEHAAALAEKLGVTPAENPVSRSLREEAAQVRAKLEKLSGVEFDRAYMDREVAYHEAVIAALEDVLIPTTENAELKAFLQKAVPTFRAHLQLAKQARDALTS
jgi:putative membrane protein